ncbi:hypothetical protein LP420_32665 [Massilia sp. B-10]|nr:hypothetical protein LP420_32665 [Massilia sp. B-10]
MNRKNDSRQPAATLKRKGKKMRTKLMRPLLGVLAVAAAYPLHAQQAPVAPLAQPGALPGQLLLRADPALADIVVTTDADQLLKPTGARWSRSRCACSTPRASRWPNTNWISADSNGGRIVDPAAAPALRLGVPLDRLLRGTRIRVDNGLARFTLIAPEHAQDVTLAVSSGALQARGQLSFVAERRPLIAGRAWPKA